MTNIKVHLYFCAVLVMNLLACQSEDSPQHSHKILSNKQAQQAAQQALQWMKTKVDLMVQHKADCNQMAHALVKHHLEHKTQLQQWKLNQAQDWMQTRAQIDEVYYAQLHELINRGDAVYSYCSFFDSFRNQLKQAVDIGI